MEAPVASITSWPCRQEEGWSLEKKVWCGPQRWQVSRDKDLKTGEVGHSSWFEESVYTHTDDWWMIYDTDDTGNRYFLCAFEWVSMGDFARADFLAETMSLAEQLAPMRPIWPRCWTSDGHHDLFDCEDGLKNAERSRGESVECIFCGQILWSLFFWGVQHWSQLDLKHFQDLHQYVVDSLSYTCENQTASGTWLVQGQARLVRHSMFSELADVLMFLSDILGIFPSFRGHVEFGGAVETNIWDALQPSTVRMTSRPGSATQLVAPVKWTDHSHGHDFWQELRKLRSEKIGLLAGTE